MKYDHSKALIKQLVVDKRLNWSSEDSNFIASKSNWYFASPVAYLIKLEFPKYQRAFTVHSVRSFPQLYLKADTK